MTQPPRSARRIIVGAGADGRSRVISDDVVPGRQERPDGTQVQELWRHERLPAASSTPDPDLGAPPADGVVVRLYTMAPAGSGAEMELHTTTNHHVITVLDGRVELLLDDEVVTLDPYDTMVIPGSSHALRNPDAVSATVIYTAARLSK